MRSLSLSLSLSVKLSLCHIITLGFQHVNVCGALGARGKTTAMRGW